MSFVETSATLSLMVSLGCLLDPGYGYGCRDPDESSGDSSRLTLESTSPLFFHSQTVQGIMRNSSGLVVKKAGRVGCCNSPETKGD